MLAPPSSSGALHSCRARRTRARRVDVATGTATLVGPTGLTVREGGLGFDPVSGELYGIKGIPAGLPFNVDTGTGAATTVGVVVGEFGAGIDASVLAFDAAGSLYVMKSRPAPEICRVSPIDASVLDRVPIPAFPTSVGSVAMAFDDASRLLYMSIDFQLATLDPARGATTPLVPTSAASGLEVVGPWAVPPAAIVAAVGSWALAALVSALAGGALLVRRGA